MARRNPSREDSAPGRNSRPWRRHAGWGLLLAAGVGLALVSTGGYVCQAETPRAAGEPGEPRGAGKPGIAGEPNRLIDESSPYLQSAAYQPVDWYPFGPEAFEQAQKLDKPILLDIGAVWCHWCHVMDRESYEDPEMGALINRLFVAVKVDRDARPDIDVRYQRAVQALTGQGGWPLTAFLTPEGKVIFGGTYFPPDTLRRLLRRVAEAYRSQKGRVLAAADEVAQRLQAYEEQSAQPGEVTPELLEQLVSSVRENFDRVHGGSPGAPKFPHGAVIRLALDRYFATGDRRLLEVAEKTLEGMARGGLRDHLHGGFYRYSTDPFWHVPHFEKMVYVQAELLAAYAQGYQATGKELYREAGEGIIRYLTETLSDQERGGFYATQDADISLDDDGTYYTWTLAEVQEVLTPAEAEVFTARFGVEAWPQRHPRETPRRNVLYVAKTVAKVAAEVGKSPAEVEALLKSALEKLRAVRREQKAPFVDPTKFSDWNGLVLSAYRTAYEAFGDERVRDFALKTADYLLETAYRPGQGMYHAVHEGEGQTAGLLEDQVYMARALLDLYEISGRERYLEVARALLDTALENFWDEEKGGFFDVAHGQDYVEVLAQPRKEVQDAPLPGPNAVAAMALEQLAVLTGEERYRQKAGETLAAFAGSAAGLGRFGATYARAVDIELSPAVRVLVVGERQDPQTARLWQGALQTYRPHKSVRVVEPGAGAMASLPGEVRAALEGRAEGAGPQSFVCVGERCAAPTGEVARLAALIRTFGLPPQQARRRVQ